MSIMEKKKVIIAEDQTIVRQGLRSLISSNEAFEVVGEAGDGLEAIRAVEKWHPHLVLLDLSMPKMNGIAAIKEIRERFPETRILALTIHKTEEHILAAFESGADGYMLKDAPEDDLAKAMETVVSGQFYISPSVSEKVLLGYLEGRKALKSETSWDTLTQREKEVLKLVAEGNTSKEIADFLCISWKTVEKHRANIMEKLDLHTAAQLTAYAIEKGLVTQ
jgi:DNA-binding NarL/FixJ family response regulator